MQWLPWPREETLTKAHVRTFDRVLAHVLVARGPGGNGIFMLGSDSPLTISDPTAVRTVLDRPEIVDLLAEPVDAPVTTRDQWATAIPGLVWFESDAVAAYVGDGPLVTDDRPFSEYFLLRTIGVGG